MTVPRTPRTNAASRPVGRDARYDSIIATAEQLIHDRGYHAVSMRDLAQAVGMQMSSLYHYFSSKEQILYGISRKTMETLINDTNTSLAEHASDDVATRLRMAIVVGVAFHIVHQHAAGVVLSDSRKLTAELHEELRQLVKTYEVIFRTLIEEGIRCGTFVRRDPIMAAYIILSALTRISIWYRPNGRLTASEIAEEYSHLLLRMIMTEEAVHSDNVSKTELHR